jgi:lipopolysaccharide export system protein LptC
MARDEPATAPASAGFEDDDDVDLSFAGPEPVAAAPWPLRLLDLVSAYLPLLMMALLASGTWWLVRNAPGVEAPQAAVAPRHEADYVMTTFVVQRFGSDGTLRTQIEGQRLRHFPDNDTIEVDDARIRAIGNDGVVTLANARKALANGDGSEVQLLGDAHIVRPAQGKEEQIEFRSDFLHAFRNIERVRSHLPVVVTQGRSVIRAQGMEYDNLARVVDLKGHTSATFVSSRSGAAR